MSAVKIIALLPGDGIGQEVVPEAQRILEIVAESRGEKFEFHEAPVGGAAVAQELAPLPAETLELCLKSDAILLGAIGDPRFEHYPRDKHPNRSLLELRQELVTYANLRPARFFPALEANSPLKPEVCRGADLLFVRELASGIYYGKPRGIEGEDGARSAVNTLRYTEDEIKRITRMAFELARKRKGRLTSVDKQNVLEVSQLWRKVVDEVAKSYPDVTVEHRLVDSFAMDLVTRPTKYDVIVTENMFGDILSDEAAALTGSLGLLPSASIGGKTDLYEPVHGSAPDIAGKGLANPIAAILTAGMMLRYSFGMEKEADAVEQAVANALDGGARTADLALKGETAISTSEMGEKIAAELQGLLGGS